MGRLEFLGTIDVPNVVPAPLANQATPTFNIGHKIIKKIGTDNLNINTDIEHTNITTEMISEIEFSTAEFNAHNTLCIKSPMGMGKSKWLHTHCGPAQLCPYYHSLIPQIIHKQDKDSPS